MAESSRRDSEPFVCFGVTHFAELFWRQQCWLMRCAGRGMAAWGVVVHADVLYLFVVRQGLINGILQRLQKPGHVAALPVREVGLKTLCVACDNDIYVPSRVSCIHFAPFPSCGFLEPEVFSGY